MFQTTLQSRSDKPQINLYLVYNRYKLPLTALLDGSVFYSEDYSRMHPVLAAAVCVRQLGGVSPRRSAAPADDGRRPLRRARRFSSLLSPRPADTRLCRHGGDPTSGETL